MPDNWARYQRHTSFILGFHGTERATVDKVVTRVTRHLNKSEGRFEWLGHGIYFWENDPQRALEWAESGNPKRPIGDPDVVGSVIDLGLCLDLTTRTALEEVRSAYDLLKQLYDTDGKKLPENHLGQDKVKRELDCQVIQLLHNYRELRDLSPYDSVRAPFLEKNLLYAGAEFRAGNHIQICVIKPENCIKGYFRPITSATAS